MINDITDKVKSTIAAFLTANYTSVTDVTANAPIYIIKEFDPADETQYANLNKLSGNYGFVIYDFNCVNDLEHPHSHMKLIYECNIAVVRQISDTWDVTNRKDVFTQGRTTPLVTSCDKIVTNLMKYFRVNNPTDCFMSDVTDANNTGSAGEYHYRVLNFRTMRMETTTIS